MKFKRSNQYPFSLSRLMDQLIQYITEHGEYPESIFLPPEEYVFLNYIMLDYREMEKHRIESFLNVPIKINPEKQEYPFGGIGGI